MELKLSEIRDIYTNLGTLKGKALPAILSFTLSVFIDEIEPLFKKTEEIKLDLAKKYGTPTEENPDNYIIKDLEEFGKEWETLLSHVETVGDFSIKLDDLKNIELPVEFFISLKKIVTK